MIGDCLLILCFVHEILFCINLNSTKYLLKKKKKKKKKLKKGQDKAKHFKKFVTVGRVMTFYLLNVLRCIDHCGNCINQGSPSDNPGVFLQPSFGRRKLKGMKRIILKYCSISLFGSLSGREWNGQERTLIPLYSLKTSNFHSLQNCEE